MPPNGRSILELKKSEKSKKFKENIVNSAKGPNDRLHKIANITTINIVQITPLILLNPHEPVRNAIEVSNKEIVEVREAMNNKTKNSTDQKIPPGIFIKIEGNTSNTS